MFISGGSRSASCALWAAKGSGVPESQSWIHIHMLLLPSDVITGSFPHCRFTFVSFCFWACKMRSLQYISGCQFFRSNKRLYFTWKLTQTNVQKNPDWTGWKWGSEGVVPFSITSCPSPHFPCVISSLYGFLSLKNTTIEKDKRTSLMKKIVAKSWKSVVFLRPYKVVNQLHRDLLKLMEPSMLTN